MKVFWATRSSLRFGFTLIEVMVALTVGAFLLLGARSILEQLMETMRIVQRESVLMDRVGNGEETLRELVGQTETGTLALTPLIGDPSRVDFSTWCVMPQGWLERCRVTLSVQVKSGNRVLVANMPGTVVTLIRNVHADALRYLVTAANGGVWLRGWGGGATSPIALGVLRQRDTLVVETGTGR